MDGTEFPSLGSQETSTTSNTNKNNNNNNNSNSNKSKSYNNKPATPNSKSNKNKKTSTNTNNNNKYNNKHSHNNKNNNNNNNNNKSSRTVNNTDDYEQFFVGTSSLIQEIDQRILVVVLEARNPGGKKLYGTLRSFDQFANLVLENCVERIFVGNEYGEKKRGLFIVRGENVMILGRLDNKVEEVDANVTKIEWDAIVRKQKAACSTASLDDAVAQ